MTSKKQISLGITLGAGAGALWGLVFIAPALTPTFGPLQLTSGRFIAYGLIAALILAPRWRQVLKSTTSQQWIQLSISAALANTLYYFLLSNAIKRGGVSTSALIIGFVPLVVTLISLKDIKDTNIKYLSVSLLLSVLGGIFIGYETITKTNHNDNNIITALLFAISALICWSYYAVLNKRYLLSNANISANDWSLLIGLTTGIQGLVLLPFAAAFEPINQPVSEWIQFITICLGLGLFSSVIGYALWNKMSRLLPISMVGQMVLFETFFALMLGFSWEKRLPTFPELAAVALLTASVITCVSAHRKS